MQLQLSDLETDASAFIAGARESSFLGEGHKMFIAFIDD
jgi:hypothetical protein